VIQFVIDFQEVSGFLPILWFPPTKVHDISEILLKVILNSDKANTFVLSFSERVKGDLADQRKTQFLLQVLTQGKGL